MKIEKIKFKAKRLDNGEWPWDKELKELDILCKKSHYWYLRHYAYKPLKRIQKLRKEGWGKDLFRDHRITKAISLTRKKKAHERGKH